jgi:hypothetical protein
MRKVDVVSVAATVVVVARAIDQKATKCARLNLKYHVSWNLQQSLTPQKWR